MTPEEYIDANKLQPLTETEKEKGKHRLKVRGTDNPMPWTEIYTRISAGMSMEHIAEMYGHGRKIALFARLEGVTVNTTISKVLDGEIEQRRKMQEIESANPTVAKTMKEMANEYAPDVGKRIALLSVKLVDKATELVEGDATSSDLLNISRAIQTMSDTVELTQRHASASQINNNNISVDGFTFELDAPPTKEEAIEAVIEEK